jgi:hypothetical protein
MSGHFHLLLSVDDANQLARFMEYVDSNLAREIKRLHDWAGWLAGYFKPERRPPFRRRLRP